jgi:signal transduction histidine kinase
MPKKKSKGETPFRPRARLLLILGEELITNEVIAVVELVKNAYDADATLVKVCLDNVTEDGKGRIIVRDNGSGMTLETILNVWLEPATNFRTSQKAKGERTKLGRPLLGEKGVGRFAAHKLGDVVRLITRAEGSDEEISLVVNWHQFDESVYLDEVPIHWRIHAPRVFKGEDHGTMIITRKLRKQWNRRMAKNLATKLDGLNSPFGKKMEFEISLVAPEFLGTLEGLPKLEEAIEKPVYLLKGDVDENGHFHYSYQFIASPSYDWMSRELKAEKDIRSALHFQRNVESESENDIEKLEDENNGLRKPVCGPFSIHFYVWDLDPQSLRDSIGRTFYKNSVKPHSGIRVYRDDFRVWPYGEPGDDWLGLDLRRVNNPTQCISRNQIIGMVEISHPENQGLRDKTDREGLISDQAFEDFKDLVTDALVELEIERRKDRSKVNKLQEAKQPEDDVMRSIGALREKTEKNQDADKYREEIDQVESTYRRRIKELLDPFMVSAGLGLAYTLPVHEIIRNIDDLQKLLGGILDEETDNVHTILKVINQALVGIGYIEDAVRGVGQIMKKGRPTKISLSAPVQDALAIMERRLKKEYIEPDFQEDERIYIRGQRNLISTAVLNLVDNSYYWLHHNKPENRRLVVRVGRDPEGNPRILVMDNGPGIQDDPALLMEPFFSRKPDGSGLGLHIVDHVQKAHKGKIVFLEYKEESDLLTGANVALVFPPESEVKE